MDFYQIFQSYHKKLLHYAYGIVKNYQEAEDMTMEAFEKLYLVGNHPNPEAFLNTIVKNRCIDYIRHKQTVKEAMLDIDVIVQAAEMKSDIIALCVKEIEQLPPMRKKIFKMIFFEDMDMIEVAEKLRISINTVRVQKMKAVSKLKVILKS